MNRFLTRLEGKLLAVQKTNPSANLPYHNNAHMQGVWGICKELLEEEVGDDKPFTGDRDWDMAALMVASLFHDWGHTGGKEPDIMNVLYARQFVADLLEKNGYSIPDHVKKIIDDLIAVTEYPFIRAPRNILEAILRDADSIYATFMNDPVIIMEHLRSEMEVAYGRSISYREMLDGQSKFMMKTEMFTPASRAYWDARIIIFINGLEAYVSSAEGK